MSPFVRPRCLYILSSIPFLRFYFTTTARCCHCFLLNQRHSPRDCACGVVRRSKHITAVFLSLHHRRVVTARCGVVGRFHCGDLLTDHHTKCIVSRPRRNPSRRNYSAATHPRRIAAHSCFNHFFSVSHDDDDGSPPYHAVWRLSGVYLFVYLFWYAQRSTLLV